MKVCKECGVKKEIGSFYKHSKMLDGHLNKCIDCVKARVKKHRTANLDRVRQYDKSRANQPQRVQARKDYVATKQGKETRKKAGQAYNKRYPLKYASHVITGNAIRDGKLVRPDKCSTCDSTEKIEGHHDDYTKPFDVCWLCEACHKEWHRHNKPIYE